MYYYLLIYSNIASRVLVYGEDQQRFRRHIRENIVIVMYNYVFIRNMKTVAILVLVLLWEAPIAHAQPNASDVIDAAADAIGAGGNLTDSIIDTAVDAVGNVTTTDVGTCLRAIGDAFGCASKAGCTCFDNATGEYKRTCLATRNCTLFGRTYVSQ
jgi:hypothetical protein